jgi:hypothetical protein
VSVQARRLMFVRSNPSHKDNDAAKVGTAARHSSSEEDENSR